MNNKDPKKIIIILLRIIVILIAGIWAVGFISRTLADEISMAWLKVVWVSFARLGISILKFVGVCIIIYFIATLFEPLWNKDDKKDKNQKGKKP